MRIIESSGLSERIAEAIDDYVEANEVTTQEVYDALTYTYACFQRYVSQVPANKLH